MPKYRVMIEQAVYTPWCKVFEAQTPADAERLANDDADRQETLEKLGWDEADSSTEWTVREDVTEQLPPTPAERVVQLEGQLTTNRATLAAILEHLSGACEHLDISEAEGDCYLCDARRAAQRGLEAAS